MKPNAARDEMTTWWDRAIETNVEALEQIVILLLRLAGIGTLVPEVATLPRALRTRILHILRPAEFAMRRLILIAAAQIHVTVPPAPDNGLPLVKEESAPNTARNEPAELRAPAFPLFDPFKRYGDPWLTEAEIAALGDPARNDRFLALAHLPPDEPLPAKSLCRRIAALRHALEDLDAHALRLARWTARRHLERTRPRRWSPIRPGLPPGWKKHPRTGTEEALKECHTLALIALRGRFERG